MLCEESAKSEVRRAASRGYVPSPMSLQDSKSSKKKSGKVDRFIPSRICTNLYNLFKD